MSKQTIGIIVAAVVVLAMILIFGFSGGGAPGGTNILGTDGEDAGPTGPVTQEALPRNVVIVVPDKGAENVPENVAVPENVSPSNVAGTASFRTFPTLKMENNKLGPQDTVTTYVGDTVTLYIEAVDADYDFTMPNYGFREIPIPKGDTKKIAFTATAEGKFTFFCQSCGGPEKGPVGYLVVVPK